ncbi:tRNA pseudouridine synthase-like 1 isoform X1 [Contarinia nasturtii]|uniref:tRNA pseudouridine synthase-like 1 isoform X1 n=1 Tax=Contarinia nasturtii TaxID=265458 RepID=UPI0012D429D7|nr:tRNA pseudouridine synthase-like 1 isoform X1 [Contarinia nasturtii]
MQRYLLNAAYIGTKYNGVSKNVNQKNSRSIEDALSEVLAKLTKRNDTLIHTSSRTDAGVHATNTTFAIDVNKNLPSWAITKRLNTTFNTWHDQIRILKTTPITNEFDVRRDVLSRSYLYRFAVCKEPIPKGVNSQIYKCSMFIPIEESFRCYFALNQDFHIERVIEAAKQLEGYHDFRSFMHVSKKQKTFHPRFCVRRMDSIEVRPGNTLATSVNYEKTMANFDFWNIEFKSRAYFYRQIRNMVGVLIAAGNGKLTSRDIYEMITIPSKNTHKLPVPSHGLYLSNVEYSAEHLANCTRTEKNLSENEMISNNEDVELRQSLA